MSSHFPVYIGLTNNLLYYFLQVIVELRVVFLKIGEIDTLKEQYSADTFIQAKWREPALDGKTVEVSKPLSLLTYSYTWLSYCNYNESSSKDPDSFVLTLISEMRRHWDSALHRGKSWIRLIFTKCYFYFL